MALGPELLSQAQSKYNCMLVASNAFNELSGSDVSAEQCIVAKGPTCRAGRYLPSSACALSRFPHVVVSVVRTPKASSSKLRHLYRVVVFPGDPMR